MNIIRIYRIRLPGKPREIRVQFTGKPQVESDGVFLRAFAKDADGSDTFIIQLQGDTFTATPVMQAFSKTRREAAIEAATKYRQEQPTDWP